MFGKFATVGLAAALCVGCMTKQPSEMSYTEIRQVIDDIKKRCTAQGYGPNHPEATACHRQEAQREVAVRRNARQAQIAFGEALQEIGANMQRQPTTTRCSRFGSDVTCRTY